MALIRNLSRLGNLIGQHGHQIRALTYTKLSEGTPADFQQSQDALGLVCSPDSMADRWLAMVEGLGSLDIGMTVNLKEHALQTATKALKDGADEETVICALFHDVGELVSPSCHGEIGKNVQSVLKWRIIIVILTFWQLEVC